MESLSSLEFRHTASSAVLVAEHAAIDQEVILKSDIITLKIGIHSLDGGPDCIQLAAFLAVHTHAVDAVVEGQLLALEERDILVDIKGDFLVVPVDLLALGTAHSSLHIALALFLCGPPLSFKLVLA